MQKVGAASRILPTEELNKVFWREVDILELPLDLVECYEIRRK